MSKLPEFTSQNFAMRITFSLWYIRKKHNRLLLSTSSVPVERFENTNCQLINKETVTLPNGNSDKLIEDASEISQSLCIEFSVSNKI